MVVYNHGGKKKTRLISLGQKEAAREAVSSDQFNNSNKINLLFIYSGKGIFIFSINLWACYKHMQEEHERK